MRWLSLLLLTCCVDLSQTDPTPNNTARVEPTSGNPSPGVGQLFVDILDVGQGDAILLRSSEGKVALIDGGTGGDKLLAQLAERQIEHINLMIATHPHSDHIGGLDDVIQNHSIGMYIDSGDVHTTSRYDRLMRTVEEHALRYQTAEAGDRFNLGRNIQVEILGPQKPMVPEGGSRSYLNSNSVIARVTHGSNCFMFTGDAEADTEARMLSAGLSPCNVLKVAHHGGSHSTGEAWLKAVQPKIALISVGEGNTYGHPAPETLARLRSVGAAIYRTDTMGAIQVQSDGMRVTVPDQPAFDIATQPGLSASVGDRININTAGAELLEELPGIGPSRAEAIIVHRLARGKFSSCEELELIAGIGEKTVSELLPHCTTR